MPQSDVQRKAVATASNGKVTPRVNIPVARVDSAVLQQGEFGSNLAPTGTAAGSSAEAIRNPSSTSPNELGSRTPPPSDVSGSFEPDVGPRGPEVNTTGRAPEFPAGESGQPQTVPRQTKPSFCRDLPVADQGVVQVGSDATQPLIQSVQKFSGPDSGLRGRGFSTRRSTQSSARPEGEARLLLWLSLPRHCAKVAGDPLRTAHQSNTPQSVKGNARHKT